MDRPEPNLRSSRAATEHRTASGELRKAARGLGILFSFLRPFVFAAGLGFLMHGLGASLESQIGGPETIGVRGVMVGIALPWWGSRT